MEKAERLLGFRPKTRFEKGIEEFVKWVKQVH
jgi:nucleoside-diphosphate-sugar epimerase